jgi:hypothetical protein
MCTTQAKDVSMSDLVQETAVTLDELAKWFKIKKELSDLKGTEAMMRSRIFKFFFPTPTEGSKYNKVPLNDGTGAVLSADYVINRTVDQAQLDALREEMFAEGSNLPQLALDQLIKWKPELSITAYRALTDEERNVIDCCLVVRPGSPQMEVKIPKAPT